MHYITKPPCDPKIMTFGAFHTDHLLEIDWSEKMGYFYNLFIFQLESSINCSI